MQIVFFLLATELVPQLNFFSLKHWFPNSIFCVESTGAYCTFLLATELVPQSYFHSLKHWFPNSIFWVAGTGAYSTFLLVRAFLKYIFRL